MTTNRIAVVTGANSGLGLVTATALAHAGAHVVLLELDRRLRAAGSPVISVLAHPGLSRTNLTPRAWADRGLCGRILARGGLLVTQSVERGAEPQLHAATAPGVRGGQFFGPAGFKKLRGPVTEVRPSREAADPAVGGRLWSVAEELTGVSYL